MMKRLEGEVTALQTELGETQDDFITIDPHQFLGIELNPWAANVAELVLWIGYLQWHFRTYGKAAPSSDPLGRLHNHPPQRHGRRSARPRRTHRRL